MTALWGAAALVIVAIVSGVVTWLVARRTTSGSVDTSEAATLWSEGTKMREELRDEVVSLRSQLTEAVSAVTSLNNEIKHSRSETEAAREETRLSREETRRLMEQIDEVQNEIKTSNALTIGALADNTETRRILLIPKDQRTEAENEHVATASDRMPDRNLPYIPSSDREMPNDE